MTQKKIEVGDIIPINQVTGFHVCREVGEEPKDSSWAQVDKISEAEMLSFIYRMGVQKEEAKEKKDKEEDIEEDEESEPTKKKKSKKSKKVKEEEEDDEIDEDEL